MIKNFCLHHVGSENRNMQDISKSEKPAVKKRPSSLFVFLVFAGIVSFLSMFSMCGGSKDYKKRSYVAEGIAISSAAKAASAEFYEKEKRFPNNNKEAGLSEPNTITGQSVKAIEILPHGKIKIIYNNRLADNVFIVLEAILDKQDKITWQCREAGLLEMNIIPVNCRNTIMDKS
ncbi:MAG: pilin [Wohlfahrtiimonas sp.]